MNKAKKNTKPSQGKATHTSQQYEDSKARTKESSSNDCGNFQ